MNLEPQNLILIQLIAALFMSGVIVFVQLVHYPLFALVDESTFRNYSQEHQKRTTWVVVAPMLVEAIAALLFCISFPHRSTVATQLVANALLVLVWLSTFGIQVPLHGKLLQSKCMTTIQRLVRTNWIRTIAWPARSAILLYEFSFT